AMLLASGLSMGLLTAHDGLGGAKANANPIDEQKATPAEPAQPIQEASALKDAYGDPLPQGALNRLGTLRQRAADSHLAVSADGKDIISVGSAMTVRVWDAVTGQLRSLRQLPDQYGY